jgi:hypothetical protein
VKLPHTVAAVRAPLITDGKGNQIRDWAHATSKSYAAWVQPDNSLEQTVNQERIVSRWRIFTEPAADILPTDRVTWQGKTFQVDGEIQGWDIGNGVHHHEGYLRLVTG